MREKEEQEKKEEGGEGWRGYGMKAVDCPFCTLGERDIVIEGHEPSVAGLDLNLMRVGCNVNPAFITPHNAPSLPAITTTLHAPSPTPLSSPPLPSPVPHSSLQSPTPLSSPPLPSPVLHSPLQSPTPLSSSPLSPSPIRTNIKSFSTDLLN
ncbi:hypothetical protein Pcinc_009748 [Petrolisthes cinctipes]|uniref:Uncharacterized protein n=1 Tax=Petrolisthes cinctipes TaxID=88211 RepID=A0AAE1G6U0_PETCI|nr:hypothetical protein Pcinc_009748 [Petrolisthes cinctipes]